MGFRIQWVQWFFHGRLKKIPWFFHDSFIFLEISRGVVFLQFNDFSISPNRPEFKWFFKGCGNPVSPRGRVKDWVWIWNSQNVLKSTKAAKFRACIIGKSCTQMISSLRSLSLHVLPPHQSTYWCISHLHSCICSFVCKQSCKAEDIYLKTLWSWQSSHGRGLKCWGWVWDSEQLIRSIET